MLENIIQYMNTIHISGTTTINVNGGGVSYELDKEIQTNDYWIDGKPIYAHTFTNSTSIPATTWTVLINLFPYSIDTLINWNFIIYSSNNNRRNLPKDTQMCYNYPSTGNISIYLRSAQDASLKYITIWYTKQTNE